MKRVLILTAVLLSACFSQPTPSGFLNKHVPFTRFMYLDGQFHTTEEFNDRVTVLVFWAEWCAFSKPVIEDLNKMAAANSRSDVVYIAASIDENSNFPALEERIKYTKVTALQHACSGNGVEDEAYIKFNGTELPHVFVIDKKGMIIAEGHGSGFVEDAVERALDK